MLRHSLFAMQLEHALSKLVFNFIPCPSLELIFVRFILHLTESFIKILVTRMELDFT